MARKIKTVKIKLDDKVTKEFTVKELTPREIIELSQVNPIFGADVSAAGETSGKQHEKGVQTDVSPAPVSGDTDVTFMGVVLKDFAGLIGAIKGIIQASCDFEMKELLDVPPSDIELIFAAFQEVNESFLALLRKMGVLEAGTNIIRAAMSDFSEMLVTS